MSKVLKADSGAAGGDSYVQKNFAAPLSPTWKVQFDLYIPTSTFTALNAAGFPANEFAADLIQVTDGTHSDGTFVTAKHTDYSDDNFGSAIYNWWADHANPTGPQPSFAPDSWLRSVEVTCDGSTLTWVYGGTTLFSYSSLLGSLSSIQIGAIFGEGVTGEVYYLDNVKVFDSSNTLVFSDGFESGDLTAWDTTVGSPSVVDDPAAPAILTADFTATPLSGVAPLTVNFTDASLPGPGGAITGWDYDYGDGSAHGTTANPSHIYASPGTYSPSLTVTSPDGTASKTRAGYIVVSEAAANTSQDTALSLSPVCGEEIISNLGATTTPHAMDPLNTVYGDTTIFARQVWFKLVNTSGRQAYARFTITNPSPPTKDIGVAVYTDNPATVPVNLVRTVDETSDRLSLTSGASVTLGCAIEAGGTVWLEVAGNDTGGHGWDGTLQLDWGLLQTVFYDTPDAGFKGLTEFVATDVSSTGDAFLTATSYARIGTTNFAAYYGHDSEVAVWVWADGGAATSYPVAPDGFLLSGVEGAGNDRYGPGIPLLRNDGENLWLTLYGTGPISNPCGGSMTTTKVGVYLWTGSGFSLIGTQNSKAFPDLGAVKASKGQLSAAACSAEPGVLHVVWSEAAAHSCTMDGNGNADQILQRVVYSKWSTSALLLDTDLASLTDTVDTFGGWTGSAYGVTGHIMVTNAFGSPVVFIGGPTTQLSMDTPGAAGSIVYGSMIEMLAIDGAGAPTVLQTVDGSITVAAGALLDADHFNFTIEGTRQPPQASYGGEDSLFFTASWYPHPDPLFVVPADGSGPITIATTGAGNIDTLGSNTQDVYDDGRNIWWGTGIYQTGFSGLSQASFTCPTMPDGGGYGSDGIRYIAPGGIELYYDAPADSFYTLGGDSSGTPTFYAPLKIPILRDYLICSVGACMSGGLHVWYRL